jgi:ornithine carbamoyltransferase
MPYESISLDQSTALLRDARHLLAAEKAGSPCLLLKGRRLGLLCEEGLDTGPSSDAAFFRRAAMQLGAHVALVHANLGELQGTHVLQETASLLGRLYDAVECQGLTPLLVQRLGENAGIPFYDGAATADHPTAVLASQLDGEAKFDERRRAILQAVLMHAFM